MNKKFKIAISLLTAITCTAAVTSTVAWFKYGTDISMGGGSDDKVQVRAGVSDGYYGGGDGTEENPYIISNKTHLYNLAWLQYLGTYNNPTINQLYFKVTSSIDMTGIALPPIGTDTYPFLGNFNGNNQTISNLTVSNNFADYGIAHPTTVTNSNYVAPQIVGFFGTVGKLPDQSISYSSSVVSMTNLTLNNLTVKSSTNQTLIGLAAGYVNLDVTFSTDNEGTMSGVKIDGDAKLDLGTTSKNAITTITDKLSDYSLVGYSTKTGMVGSYSQSVSNFYDSGTAGETPGWGGSIDMLSFNKRIYNKLQKGTRDGTGSGGGGGGSYSYYTYTDSTDVMYIAPNNSTYFNPESNAKTYNLGYKTESTPTIMPLSVYLEDDLDRAESYSASSKYSLNTLVKNGASYYRCISAIETPETWNSSHWTQVSLYDTKPSNTGFVVGGNTYVGTQAHIKAASSNISKISNSTGSSSSYNSSSCVIFTNSSSSYSGTDSTDYALIQDEETVVGYSPNTNPSYSGYSKRVSSSDFARYESSRAKLHNVLNGADYVQGIRFNNSNTLTTSNAITTPNGFNAYLNGDTSLTNYPLLSSAINFSLYESGYINFFEGSYTNGGGNQNVGSIFRVYYIIRNASSNAIQQVGLIDKVYENKGTGKKTYPVVYLDSNNNVVGDYGEYGNSYSNNIDASKITIGETGNRTLVFDMDYLGNIPEQNAIYYFEIRMNKGEFALGGGSGTGGYLMYLDIGANAGEIDHITAYSVTTYTNGNSYPYGVDFATTDLISTNGGETLGVILPAGESGASGAVTFNVSETTISYTSTITEQAQYAYKIKTLTTSGTPPTDPINAGNAFGVKVYTFSIVTTEADEWSIILTDTYSSLTDYTSSYTLISLNGESTTESNLPTAFTTSVATIKNYLADIITINRTSGVNTFDAIPQYSGTNYTTVLITIDDTDIDVSFSNIDTDYNITVENTSGTVLYPSN